MFDPPFFVEEPVAPTSCCGLPELRIPKLESNESTILLLLFLDHSHNTTTSCMKVLGFRDLQQVSTRGAEDVM